MQSDTGPRQWLLFPQTLCWRGLSQPVYIFIFHMHYVLIEEREALVWDDVVFYGVSKLCSVCALYGLQQRLTLIFTFFPIVSSPDMPVFRLVWSKVCFSFTAVFAEGPLSPGNCWCEGRSTDESGSSLTCLTVNKSL